MTRAREFWQILLALFTVATVGTGPASEKQTLKGQVLEAGAPIANATVTLWAASAGASEQVAQSRTRADGRFSLEAIGAGVKDATLYLVAKGGAPEAAKKSANDAIALMALLGPSSPQTLTINELKTVASAFTAAQFIEGNSTAREFARAPHRRDERNLSKNQMRDAR